MESALYQQLRAASKRSKRNLTLTRIENWASQGIPDLLICDETGKFHFVELKFVKANAVNLSPHQVAWHIRHKHSSCWTIIKKQNKPDSDPVLFLYHAEQAMDLKANGLKTEPKLHQEKKFVWDDVFDLICPI
jgi:hypothetical protein